MLQLKKYHKNLRNWRFHAGRFTRREHHLPGKRIWFPSWDRAVPERPTMLNIIGDWTRYTSGDLIINGVSTKEYQRLGTGITTGIIPLVLSFKAITLSPIRPFLPM